MLVVVPLCTLGAWFKKDKKAEQEKPKTIEMTRADLSAGSALFFSLLSDEKNVSKLLLVKREGDELDRLINDIADVSKEAHKKLGQIGKEAGTDLENTHLPAAEVVTRDSIAREKAGNLLRLKGTAFENYLLSTQEEALTYGVHLARSLGKAETDVKSREFLARTEEALGILRDRVSELMRKYRKEGK